MRICLDPGHWRPADPGAVGQGGTCEADVTLAICGLLEQELVELGHQVTLTHTGDPNDFEANDLWPRVERAIAWGADCFISIHCNGAVSMQAHGFETYSTRGQDESDRFQECIHNAVMESIPELSDRGQKEAGFVVLKGPFPSVLIETAFISNPKEERWLVDVGFQKRFAEAIARGVNTFLVP